MSIEVLCVGHATCDFSLFLDRFPTENSKAETGEWLEACGGPAANAAYLVSRWGARCAFAGLVGDDHYGRRIREELVTVGTDVSLLQMPPDHATPFSVILINTQSGSRTIVNRKVPGRTLDLDAAAFSSLSPKVLLFDGHEHRASLAALSAFPDAMSILDAGSWRQGTADLAGRVGFLVASERFARQVTGVGDLREDVVRRACLARLRERFPTTVVVTLGQDGLIADDGSGFSHVPAFPAEAVDTTGAGDIFHGAFAFCIAQSVRFWESLRLASMAASLSVRERGGRASIPTLARVQEALTHVR